MKNKVFKIFVIMILSVNISYAGSNPKIDKATFQEIDAVYAKDKNGVYKYYFTYITVNDKELKKEPNF